MWIGQGRNEKHNLAGILIVHSLVEAHVFADETPSGVTKLFGAPLIKRGSV